MEKEGLHPSFASMTKLTGPSIQGGCPSDSLEPILALTQLQTVHLASCDLEILEDIGEQICPHLDLSPLGCLTDLALNGLAGWPVSNFLQFCCGGFKSASLTSVPCLSQKYRHILGMRVCRASVSSPYKI